MTAEAKPANPESALETAAKLAEHEKQEIAKRAEVLQKVIREVEKLLVDNKISIKEWGDMVEFFNQYTNIVIPKLTMDEIKRRIRE